LFSKSLQYAISALTWKRFKGVFLFQKSARATQHLLLAGYGLTVPAADENSKI